MSKRKLQSDPEGANVSFECGEYERRMILRIAQRATEMGLRNDCADSHTQGWMMDVTATHCNGCPLRLKALLEADNFNFSHDLTGIYRHLNRKRGELENYFRPRFAK